MSRWYWRDGSLAVDGMDDPNWKENMREIEKKLGDADYKRVAYTELDNGYRVSTVWLGLDHSMGSFAGREDAPLIFETMVFPQGSFRDQDCQRYSTEQEALSGHEEMVRKWKEKEKYENTSQKV